MRRGGGEGKGEKGWLRRSTPARVFQGRPGELQEAFETAADANRKEEGGLTPVDLLYRSPRA